MISRLLISGLLVYRLLIYRLGYWLGRCYGCAAVGTNTHVVRNIRSA